MAVRSQDGSSFAGADWPFIGGDWTNSRYSTLDQIRVVTGTVVTFVNSGRVTHAIAATNGAWTTGPLAMAESGFVTFDEPGTHTYHCEEHPWTIGQVFVEP